MLHKTRAVIAVTLLAVICVVSVGIAPSAGTVGSPPQVSCVPVYAPTPWLPHDTWSGLEITLKGVAHDSDGDATLATYCWDFGNGSPPECGAVTDPYAIEARHVYVGNVGDVFVARLTVTDTSGESGTDDYLVAIRDGADIKVRVNVAIDEGLWRLHKDQMRGALPDGTPYGCWPYYGWDYPAEDDWTVAATGASTEAFEIHGSLPSGDPNEDPYVETVQRGLNYLLSQMYSYPVAQDPTYCPLGDPDVNGNGYGLGCYTDYWSSTYECGIALMTLASSKCPSMIAATGIPEVVGRTYLDIAQDMVDYLAWGQTDPQHGDYRGGWRYFANFDEPWDELSDNSCSQWPVIGMEAAEVNFGYAGLLVPQFVKDELSLWIDYIQNDASGGSGYEYPWDWVNIAKTGGLLCEMKFCGDDPFAARVQAAVEYIYTNWTTDPEHFDCNNFYAFYSVMKGFRLLGIETIHPINDPTGFDWYADPTWGYAPYLTSIQNADGSWPADSCYPEEDDEEESLAWPPLTTAWALLTLRKTVVQPGPVADAGPDVPNHPPCPIEITFDGTGSYHRDPERSIVGYAWDFGDGSPPVEGPIVTHCFPAYYNPDGTIDWTATTRDYAVTLTVTDDSTPPLTDTDSCVVHITGPPWPPVADPDGPYTACQCRPMTLDGSASYDPNDLFYPDPDHPWHCELVSWEWDLDNDGQYDDATGPIVTWSSCELGLYVVGLKVTNDCGGSDAVDTLINVVECPCECDVAIDRTHCKMPAAGQIGQCKTGQIGAKNMSLIDSCEVVMRVTDNAGIVVFETIQTIDPGDRIRVRFNHCYTADEVGRDVWTWEVWPVGCDERTPWNNVHWRKVNVQPGTRSSPVANWLPAWRGWRLWRR